MLVSEEKSWICSTFREKEVNLHQLHHNCEYKVQKNVNHKKLLHRHLIFCHLPKNKCSFKCRRKMLDEELDIVQTCGLCEMIISQNDIKSLLCLEGYTQYYTDNSTLYFYPIADDGKTLITKTVIENKESTANTCNKDNISGNQHLKKASHQIILKKGKKNLSFDEEEILILEV